MFNTSCFAKIVCFLSLGRTMELDDFNQIKVEKIQDIDDKKLIISGRRILKDSALTIYKVKSKQIKNEINIQVILNITGCEKGEPNEFNYTTILNDKVTKITFGKQRSVIWGKK